MDRSRVHLIAKLLCEFEAKDWLRIRTEDRDRFLRIAIMLDYKISQHDTVAGKSNRDGCRMGDGEGED